MQPSNDRKAILQRGRQIIEQELDAARSVLERLDPESFPAAVLEIANAKGRLVVTGIGKAGLIGQKIAATFSSTGTPAFVLHPVEALHGDLGMVRPGDVVLALSNSGQTDELRRTLAALKQLDCRIIIITGRRDSSCAQLCDIVLDFGRVAEACPLGLAPSSSTAAMLVLGDALALTVMFQKDVPREQYARFHPAGELGRSLMRVHEIMRSGDQCPQISPDQTIRDYINVIRRAAEKSPARASGAVAVVDERGHLVGFFTDGDLRRLIDVRDRPADARIADVMTRNPKSARRDDYVVDAAKIMREYRIDELPVVDEAGACVGMIDIQDLISAGFSVFDAR
ncbi:MAG: KpsF/GutQ family sugar-phosphate isomerase [Phycisphaerales bacterium]|nr:MAG: KpsF/GutQ family sugar-phosphate isomerase [Phycisphaerales bacterium]